MLLTFFPDDRVVRHDSLALIRAAVELLDADELHVVRVWAPPAALADLDYAQSSASKQRAAPARRRPRSSSAPLHIRRARMTGSATSSGPHVRDRVCGCRAEQHPSARASRRRRPARSRSAARGSISSHPARRSRRRPASSTSRISCRDRARARRFAPALVDLPSPRRWLVLRRCRRPARTAAHSRATIRSLPVPARGIARRPRGPSSATRPTRSPSCTAAPASC